MKTGNIINWYPGHMKKASDKLLEVIKQIDIVVELVDARAPISTRNIFFKKNIKNKIHILVYMKSDLADLNKIKTDNKNINNIIFVSIKNKKSVNNLIKKIIYFSKGKITKVLIVGIPNVGKSSLINSILNKKAVKSENKPGVTKNFQWLNFNDKFYLLDTPGILPIKYDNSNYNIAILNGIKEKLIPIIDLSEYAYSYIIKYYSDLYKKRYKEIKNNSNDSFKYISELRGIKNDKSLNFESSRIIFLNDIKNGKLGRLFLEIETIL